MIEQHCDVMMCYFDLDNFKPYNDIYGFAKGDKTIRSTAELLVNHTDTEIDFIDLYPAFYTDKHQQGMSAQDRHGKMVFYPLLALSIGVVRIIEFPLIKNEADLAEYPTKAKSALKEIVYISLNPLILFNENNLT